MNYKFQVGDLVEVDLGGLLERATPLLALVTDRFAVPDSRFPAPHEVYTVTLPGGSEYAAPRDDLRKAGE